MARFVTKKQAAGLAFEIIIFYDTQSNMNIDQPFYC